jgi:hypothetical protein
MKAYIVKPVSRKEADHLVRKHYLHRWPGVAVCIVGLLDSGSCIGTIVFALPPRETAKRYRVRIAWELARLFIEDGTPKNTETWFMSRAINYLHLAHPEVEVLVSYADPSVGHAGTIYRAGNWISDGQTDQERKTPRFDYMVEGKVYSRRSHVPQGAVIQRVPRGSKYRFIYWMKEHEKRRRECAGIMRRI